MTLMTVLCTVLFLGRFTLLIFAARHLLRATTVPAGRVRRRLLAIGMALLVVVVVTR